MGFPEASKLRGALGGALEWAATVAWHWRAVVWARDWAEIDREQWRKALRQMVASGCVRRVA